MKTNILIVLLTFIPLFTTYGPNRKVINPSPIQRFQQAGQAVIQRFQQAGQAVIPENQELPLTRTRAAVPPSGHRPLEVLGAYQGVISRY
jgi:hypothetical protein